MSISAHAPATSAPASLQEAIRARLVYGLGKTVAEATMEVSRTPANLRYYATEATRCAGVTLPAVGDTLLSPLR